MTYRLQLERAILGAVLLERQSFIQVADILTHKNFSKTDLFDHGLIWRTIEQRYPVQPMDLISLYKELNAKFYATYLVELTTHVCSAANLRYHAFALLEVSIKESFIALLHTHYERTPSLSLKAALQEIIDEVLENMDVLSTLTNSMDFLHGLDEDVYNDVRAFENSVARKADAIKKTLSVEMIMRNLGDLAYIPRDDNARATVHKLIEHVKTILSTGKVDSDLSARIQSL